MLPAGDQTEIGEKVRKKTVDFSEDEYANTF